VNNNSVNHGVGKSSILLNEALSAAYRGAVRFVILGAAEQRVDSTERKDDAEDG